MEFLTLQQYHLLQISTVILVLSLYSDLLVGMVDPQMKKTSLLFSIPLSGKGRGGAYGIESAILISSGVIL